jgi:hypothetical protein
MNPSIPPALDRYTQIPVALKITNEKGGKGFAKELCMYSHLCQMGLAGTIIPKLTDYRVRFGFVQVEYDCL